MTDAGRPTDPASLVKWMADIEAYKDKAVYSSAARDDAPDDDGEGCKAIVVEWLPGERVRLIGGEPGEWGHVIQIKVDGGAARYQVSWPQSKSWTYHHGFELEDAD